MFVRCSVFNVRYTPFFEVPDDYITRYFSCQAFFYFSALFFKNFFTPQMRLLLGDPHGRGTGRPPWNKFKPSKFVCPSFFIVFLLIISDFFFFDVGRKPAENMKPVALTPFHLIKFNRKKQLLRGISVALRSPVLHRTYTNTKLTQARRLHIHRTYTGTELFQTCSWYKPAADTHSQLIHTRNLYRSVT